MLTHLNFRSLSINFISETNCVQRERERGDAYTTAFFSSLRCVNWTNKTHLHIVLSQNCNRIISEVLTCKSSAFFSWISFISKKKIGRRHFYLFCVAVKSILKILLIQIYMNIISTFCYKTDIYAKEQKYRWIQI